MTVELHVVIGGVDRGPLPSYLNASFTPVFCDIGGLAFSYPKKGKKYGLIKGMDELEIVPWVDGVPQPRLGGYVNQLEQDDVADVSIVKYSGQSYLRRLEEIIVYPNGWPNYNTHGPSLVLTDQNPGQILKKLLDDAVNRGTGTDLTRSSFNVSTDSNGVAWAKMITLEVKPGATVLDVMRSMYSNNMIEFEMVGKDLRVYNYGTLGTDRTVVAAGQKPLTFRKGRDLLDSPRKLSSRDIYTVMLAAGKEDAGIYREKTNAGAIATRRRIEGFVSNGNLVDNGTLDAFTEAQLGRSVNPVMEKTHGLALSNKKSPQPLTGFNVGDWAYSDSGEGLERLRIKSWVLSIDEKGFTKGSVTLNDMIAEAAANLSKRIDGIIGGSTITGESKAVDAVPVDLTDGVAPNAPLSLSMSSAPYNDGKGNTYAQITATWPQVTTNTDGSPTSDLAGYNIRWRYKNGPATAWNNVDSPGNATTASWSPVAPATVVEAQIRSYDRAGNYSSYSGLYQVTTQDDTTAPDQPSTPIVDNYLGLVRVTWDGKTATGAAWAPDVNRWQVHASTTNDFTPTTATWVDTLTAAGSSYIDPGYGETRFVKIVAMDRTGNLSTPSAQGSATTSQLLSDDIFAGAVGTEKLADLAVTTAKIANLAVNTAQIGSVDAGRITAGVMSAALTVSGRIATALVGKRVEMNGVGFQGFDAQGNNTLSLDGANNLMQGTFRTALGGRRIEIAAAGNQGEVNFYGPSGQLGKVVGFTDNVSYFTNEAIALVYPVSGKSFAWNTVTVSSKEETYISAGLTTIYCGGDNTSQNNRGFQVRWALDRGSSTTLFNPGYVRIQVDSTLTSLFDAWQNQKFVATGTFVRIGTHRSGVFNGDSGGYINIAPASTDDTSAIIVMFGGAGTLAGNFYFVSGEFRFVQNSAYTATRASAFNVSSDESTKRHVRRLSNEPGTARDKLAPMVAHAYRVKGARGVSKRDQVGYMAHTAPDEIRVPDDVPGQPGTDAIDLYGLTTLGIEYTKEVDAELAALRAEVAELKELIKA